LRKAPKRGHGFRFVRRALMAPLANLLLVPVATDVRFVVSCQVLLRTVVLTQTRRNGGALWVLTSRAGGLRHELDDSDSLPASRLGPADQGRVRACEKGGSRQDAPPCCRTRLPEALEA
jgi:hypothetical protein